MFYKVSMAWLQFSQSRSYSWVSDSGKGKKIRLDKRISAIIDECMRETQ